MSKKDKLSDRFNEGNFSKHENDTQSSTNNDEQNMILQTTHPFEKIGITNNKMLTITQKAIICRINMSGGCASENQILRFLRKHWQFIRKNSSKDYKDTASLRLLHINFRTKKAGLSLFVETEKGSEIWKCNTPPIDRCIRESNGVDGQHEKGFQMRFEDCLAELLNENPDGLSIDEIVKKAECFIDSPGFFRELNDIDPEGRRRVRAMLTVKSHTHEVFKDEATQKWRMEKFKNDDMRNSKKLVELPEFLKRCRINELSSDELYKMVRRKS